ncbi:MAG: hypothetical protein AB1324_06615 [Candidatus Micrarchaeota archaeon]
MMHNPQRPANPPSGGKREPLAEAFRDFLSTEGLMQVRDERGKFVMSSLRNWLLPGKLGAIRYGGEEIEQFSLSLPSLAGSERQKCDFLSILVHCGRENDYVVHVSGFARPPDYLLRANRKRVMVHGNAGKFACSGMADGSVTFLGGCGSHLGQYMMGGCIRVEGGLEMEGLALGMAGGGRIFHGDVLVAGKP